MAVVYHCSRSLYGQARRYAFLASACALAGGGCLFAAGFTESFLWRWPYLLLLAALAACMLYYRRKYYIFRAGAAGETELLEELKRLPRGYHVFANYRIAGRRVRDEIDFIVLGAAGIFVVEAKNHTGSITGGSDDAEWTQCKRLRSGKMRVKKIRNPVWQAKRHRDNVERLLRGEGRYAAPRALLVFTNPRVFLRISSGGMTVLKDCRAVRSYILNGRSARRFLGAQEIQAATELLLQYERGI